MPGLVSVAFIRILQDKTASCVLSTFMFFKDMGKCSKNDNALTKVISWIHYYMITDA